MSQVNNFDRRHFLKKTATAVGAIGFPYVVSASALGKDNTVAPSNRIVMAAIGVGGMGSGNMRGFIREAQVQMIAVCDVDKKHRGRASDYINEKYKNNDCKVYNDFRELLVRDDIDAVMIAVPDHWHALIAVEAARAGKDIYGEKPLAYTIAEGRAICDAVKRYNIVWQTGSWQRSQQQFRHACELVRNGRIGKVKVVKVGLGGRYRGNEDTQPAPVPQGFDYDMWLGPAPLKPYSPGRCHWHFRWISDYAGGKITDWAGHHCDIAQWAMGTDYGSPVEIKGHGMVLRPADDLYDTLEDYWFECRYAEGFKMTVSNKNKGGVVFEGTEGWIHIDRRLLEASSKSIVESVIGPNEIHLYESNDHYQNFLDCVRSRSLTVTPVEVAHRSIMIGHLGIIAMKMQRTLEWDPEKEIFTNDPEANRLLSRPMRGPWHL